MRKRGLTVALILAAALTLFFAVRAVFFAVSWLDPARGTHPVEAWMTPRYLVRSYGVPPEALAEVLGLPQGSSPRAPLAAIAEAQDVPVEALIAAIEAQIAKARVP